MTILQVLWLITVAVSPLVGAEDDELQADDEPVDLLVTPLDTAVIVFFTISCAIFLSFFGVLLGYFSVKEDMLMRRYQRDGIRIRAAIDTETIQYTRHLVAASPPSPRCCCRDRKESNAQELTLNSQQECTLVIEYRSVDPCPQGFAKRVRKQVRAIESDFVETNCWKPPRLSSILFDMLPEEKHISFEGPVPSHDFPGQHGLELEILQLLPYKKSGLPRNQVERACSWSYRLPTMVMVMVIVVFAASCIFFAMDMIAIGMDADRMDVIVWSSAVISVMLTCEILLIRACGETYMNFALQHEYLDGAGILLDYGDSASLSSGEDSFLKP